VPDNLQLRGKIMSELGNVWVQLGNTERGVELYTAALGTAQEAEDPERCMRVHGNLGLALKELGELSQAEEQLQSTVNLARELEDSFMEGRGSMDLAAVYRAKGDLGAALTALRRASELAEQLGDSEACGECYTQLGGLHLLRCEPSQATEQLQLAVAVWQSRADELTAAMLQRRQELGLQVSDDPDLVLLYDDHADTFTLLISALLASAPPGAPSPSDAMRALLAAESGRATVLRNLLALGATSPPLAPTEGEQTIPGLEAPTAAAAVARAAPPLELEQISEVLGKLYGESAGPEAGVLVYYALVDDFTGEAPPSLCVWCLSADGGVQTYQGAGAADGRSLNEAAADLHEKLALLAHAHTTRGAKCSAEAHDKQKEDLASRGVLQVSETVQPCPAPHAPRPTPHAPRPTPHAPRPTPHAPRPSPLAPRPTPHAPRPTPHAPRPTPHAPRPSPLAACPSPRPPPLAPRPSLGPSRRARPSSSRRTSAASYSCSPPSYSTRSLPTSPRARRSRSCRTRRSASSPFARCPCPTARR
jgi:tetratricopeptide (TPR) repeat protein